MSDNEFRELGTDPETGKAISVKEGQYGPYVQLGTKDDDERPRFVSLMKTQTLEALTLEDALLLLKLPRNLGVNEDGKEILAGIGRYGPYVKCENKFVSIDDNPCTIELDRALVLIKEQKKADAKKVLKEFPEQGIKVLDGRYGPYATDGKTNATIKDDTDIQSLTAEDCLKLIEAKAKKSK